MGNAIVQQLHIISIFRVEVFMRFDSHTVHDGKVLNRKQQNGSTIYFTTC